VFVEVLNGIGLGKRHGMEEDQEGSCDDGSAGYSFKTH
jgi:hypothetical protein